MNEQFTNPSQIGPAGASSLRVPSRLSDSRQAWGVIAQSAKAIAGLRGGTQSVDDKLNALKESGFRCLDRPHPFKIYQLPEILNSSPNPATDWLTFYVRSGYVGSTPCNGTDGIAMGTFPYTPDSYDIPLPPPNSFQALAGVNAWFVWIDTTGSAPTVMNGSNPASQGWTGYPANDANHILIGYIDTITLQAGQQAIVRQILRTDYNTTTSGNSNYQGIYVSGQTYNLFDEVLIQSGAGNGLYISLANGNSNAPTSGINWVQVSSLNQWF